MKKSRSELEKHRELVRLDSEKTSLLDFVSGFGGIENPRFVKDSKLDMDSVWGEFTRYSTAPHGRMRGDCNDLKIKEWVLGFLLEMGIQRSCFISVGGYSKIPWLHITLKDGPAPIVEMWSAGDNRGHDLVLTNSDMSHALGILEEEYEIELFKSAF